MTRRCSHIGVGRTEIVQQDDLGKVLAGFGQMRFFGNLNFHCLSPTAPTISISSILGSLNPSSTRATRSFPQLDKLQHDCSFLDLPVSLVGSHCLLEVNFTACQMQSCHSYAQKAIQEVCTYHAPSLFYPFNILAQEAPCFGQEKSLSQGLKIMMHPTHRLNCIESFKVNAHRITDKDRLSTAALLTLVLADAFVPPLPQNVSNRDNTIEYYNDRASREILFMRWKTVQTLAGI